ncbi:hypothetical protein Cfor_11995 [Coptotermes formosanus]|uniref:RING-type domain-containing protein n=1 Tax=Coptotermes formosanus TaxID=36987 RepID=A0A6L2Q6E3_COPFO|nr:hypothetical protein Cfor_11995 [Coptotermes formosanus]
MVGNPYRYRAALQQLENRHATAGPQILLQLSRCGRTLCEHTVNSLQKRIKLVCKLFKTLFADNIYRVSVSTFVPHSTGRTTVQHGHPPLARSRLCDSCSANGNRLLLCWLFVCQNEVRLQAVTHTPCTTKVLFFLLAEKILCPEQRLACLYCLLFYTVLAYLQRSLHTRHWTQLLNENSAADFIKLTTTFIVVRLGKGMAMSMVLLTFTLQFNHLEPTYGYVALTLLYFILSQYKGAAGEETFIVSAVRRLELQVLEGFEEFWIPLAIYGSTVAMSGTLVLAAIWQLNYWTLCTIVGKSNTLLEHNEQTINLRSCVERYANVYVCGQQVLDRYWRPLATQRAVISLFPLATLQQMAERGDTTCPVCLDDMRLFAVRITPCSHIFHGQCLRKCIIQFAQCPLCKQPL